MEKVIFAFISLLFFTFAAAAQARAPLSGTWSGRHATVEFSDDGARFEFDCAAGIIGQRVSVNRSGSFSLVGTYTEESGGPVRMDSAPEPIEAVYIGSVKGNRLTLVIKRKRGLRVIGRFSLYKGREPELVKCR